MIDVTSNRNDLAEKRRELILRDNVLRSEELFLGGREITILHQGEHYKLRLTGNDRLILNK